MKINLYINLKAIDKDRHIILFIIKKVVIDTKGGCDIMLLWGNIIINMTLKVLLKKGYGKRHS
jgi:hypothetical protein